MSHFFESFLWQSDVQASVGCLPFPEQTTLLVSDGHDSEHEGWISAKRWVPEGSSSALTLHDIMGHSKDKVFDSSTIRWDTDAPQQLIRNTFWSM